MKSALEYSLRALEAAPDQAHFKFNVAFVQIQIAQLIYTLPDASRTLVDVEAAASGLDEAIESFISIARSPNPPFPKHDIEQRANMGKNTMRKQLERAMQSQRDYEQKNAARLDSARQQRDTEIRKRDEQKRLASEKQEEHKRKIAEERARMMEEDRKIIEQKIVDEADRKAREADDLTTDEETGEKKKREKRRGGGKGGKRKKKGDDSDSDIINDDSDDADADFGGKKSSRRRSFSGTPASGNDAEERSKEKPKKKKRKLERKGKPIVNSKFKSSELVVDSDSDDAAVTAQNDNTKLAEKINSPTANDEDMADGDDNEDAVVEKRRNKPARVIDEDDEDEEDEAPNGNHDVSMVDESAPAAGNENALES